MGKINYHKIYQEKRDGWKEATSDNSNTFKELFAGQYSENNHFVYELLQNAEDADATFITFVYRSDRLVIYHNGRPFDERDVDGICSVMKSAKDKNSAQTIGHFGFGFKSVFKYTARPEVYSNDEAFAIERYLLPVELDRGSFPVDCCYQMGEQTVYPFADGGNATKFVLPFEADLKSSGIDPRDIVEKLKNLGREILLFLRHIQKLTWVDEVTGEFGVYERETHSTDEKICICRQSSSGAESEESRYLIYNKQFSTDEMADACVKLAFRLGHRRIEAVSNAKVWVFFPTTDKSGLFFLIHGTYQTPISREKIISDSNFNQELYRRTEDLVVESMKDLRARGLLTQTFLREILLPSFSSPCLTGLKEKMTTAFSEEDLLPVFGSGDHRSARKVRLALPYNLPDFVKNEQLSSAVGSDVSFVAFNDQSAAGFSEYYRWLRNDLKVEPWTVLDLVDLLTVENLQDFGGCSGIFFLLRGLPRYENRGTPGNYSGDLANICCICNSGYNIGSLWKKLREKPLLPNQQGKFCAAWTNGKHNLYLQDEKSNNQLLPGKYVDIEALLPQESETKPSVPTESSQENSLREDYKRFLSQYLGIPQYDHRQYVEEEIYPKYRSDFRPVSDDEHVEDLRQIFLLDPSDVLQYVSFIRVDKRGKAGEIQYCSLDDPRLYLEVDRNELSLRSYFSGISEQLFVDMEFYESHGFSRKEFRSLGVRDTVVEGENCQKGTCDKLQGHRFGLDGRSNWQCFDEFRYQLFLTDLEKVLHYIQEHPNSDNAREKSKIIFTLLLKNSQKLHGRIELSSDQKVREMDCELIQYLNGELDSSWKPQPIPWLFTQDHRLVSAQEISRYELDPALYPKLPDDSILYKCLKFREDERDYRKKLERLPDSDLKKFIRNGDIAKEILSERGDPEISRDIYGVQRRNWEFPQIPIRNLDRLQQHVREEFACTSPVRYERILRSIRTSKGNIDPRSYLESLYEEDGKYGCQLCHEPVGDFEAVQILEDSEKELEQIHLCLCPNCATKYRSLRRDSSVVKQLQENILAWKPMIGSGEPVSISLGSEHKDMLMFTPVHLAEVQTLLNCLAEDENTADKMS